MSKGVILTQFDPKLHSLISQNPLKGFFRDFVVWQDTIGREKWHEGHFQKKLPFWENEEIGLNLNQNYVVLYFITHSKDFFETLSQKAIGRQKWHKWNFPPKSCFKQMDHLGPMWPKIMQSYVSRSTLTFAWKLFSTTGHSW